MSDTLGSWQPSLLDGGATGFNETAVGFDPAFADVSRHQLGDGAWVEHLPGWVRGADVLFDQLLAACGWQQHTIWMYDHRVTEPRLTARYHLAEDLPPVAILTAMAEALSARYGVTFTQVGANLYRSGSDSVAWHGDRVARELPEATVALVSLGEPRPFKLRPKEAPDRRREAPQAWAQNPDRRREAVVYVPGRGDLLVMGGSCQRTWEHSVPKVRAAGPRMSVQFRHAYE